MLLGCVTMKVLWLLAGALYSCQIAAAISSSNGVEASGSPFRFQPSPQELPNQNYGILKGIAAKNEPKRIFWPLEKPSSVGTEGVSAAYTENSFPNPFLDPTRCVRLAGVSHTWICDPDMLLNPDQQAFIESRLLFIRDRCSHVCSDGKRHNYQLAVAVAPDIATFGDEPPQQAADRMASRMLRQWGIGNKSCHDGMLLLFVPNRNVASFAMREGVERKYFSESYVKYVQYRVTSTYLLTRDVNSAVYKGVYLIESQLPIAITNLGWIGIAVVVVLGLYLLSVILAFSVFDYLLTKEYLFH